MLWGDDLEVLGSEGTKASFRNLLLNIQTFFVVCKAPVFSVVLHLNFG